ncbi:uncharacterized protein LOC112890238 [Panicum hallii]|uniref:uncharacterized protein LOC112890238 n=1 Tax=Panicum hallii TaxID=206008 RepID=UPI000DF4D20A|nr:uncharacterized protein LOC112890238 [Panicum hallii]
MPGLRAEETCLRTGVMSGSPQSSILAARAPLLPTAPSQPCCDHTRRRVPTLSFGVTTVAKLAILRRFVARSSATRRLVVVTPVAPMLLNFCFGAGGPHTVPASQCCYSLWHYCSGLQSITTTPSLRISVRGFWWGLGLGVMTLNAYGSLTGYDFLRPL